MMWDVNHGHPKDVGWLAPRLLNLATTTGYHPRPAVKCFPQLNTQYTREAEHW